MKRKLTMLILFILMLFPYANADALTLQYDGITTEYSGSLFDLKVNGVTPSMPLSPIIFNDRALVPVREVFESLGAKVDYIETDKSVNISYYDNNVTLYIDKDFGYVNGRKTNIPDGVSPKLINILGEPAKTMVPVRFISESLNISVDFRDNTIYISNGESGIVTTPAVVPATPAPVAPAPVAPAPVIPAPVVPDTSVSNEKNQITSVSFYSSVESQLVVTVLTTKDIGNISSFNLTDPARIVVDISDALVKTPTHIYDVNQCGVSQIRLGEHANMSRIVIDVEKLCPADVKKYGKSLVITLNSTGTNIPQNTVQPQTPPPAQPQTPSTNTSTGSQSGNTRPGDITNISAVVFSNDVKAIVLDAGHGGIDSGALGNLNGKQIKESDLTLSIVQRARDILKQKGYTVVLTRDSDVYPTLQARAEFANASNAAVFVSVHINSATVDTAHGTEVYYADENNGTAYGLQSSSLAQALQYNLVKNLGFRDRGVKMANHAVTRRSLMPAALVEVGFISNPDELSKMASDEYLQKAAIAISDGIISVLNQITIPQ